MVSSLLVLINVGDRIGQSLAQRSGGERAAAIAKRHPLDRAVGAAFRASGYAFGAFLVAYVAFTLYLHFKRPVISVDTLQAFRERVSVPAKPDHAAWPRYRDALLALEGPYGNPDLDSPGWRAINNDPRPGDRGQRLGGHELAEAGVLESRGTELLRGHHTANALHVHGNEDLDRALRAQQARQREEREEQESRASHGEPGGWERLLRVIR